MTSDRLAGVQDSIPLGESWVPISNRTGGGATWKFHLPGAILASGIRSSPAFCASTFKAESLILLKDI